MTWIQSRLSRLYPHFVAIFKVIFYRTCSTAKEGMDPFPWNTWNTRSCSWSKVCLWMHRGGFGGILPMTSDDTTAQNVQRRTARPRKVHLANHGAESLSKNFDHFGNLEVVWYRPQLVTLSHPESPWVIFKSHCSQWKMSGGAFIMKL